MFTHSINSTYKVGQGTALFGVVLPLLLIGALKFTPTEVEALKPIINGTPWLTWLYAVFGFAGASYFIGMIEIITATLLIMSVWSARAGIIGGVMGAMTFLVTVSTLLVLPIWEDKEGGFPFLNFLGQFLIKDFALLGISILVLTSGFARLRARS
ncbi:DUF417 family protein [Pseudoalteromonas luteoviolacea]|uniref:DUF417 family protein n=1 Tax=Pseudoalteromonas luteoviolacea S4054 TaxID=1129367 RepID=A0A0F6AE12_9GAMM|nr:DUF417 family protein [Pseudoalteromonas luteoviolacea]AOT08055.1 hypothetical protein S4054249_09440 [Pseudoalteromonas luteoviolacea]AOT12972.1 hypothetical protein S40542_09440 [Pseudoalteromonas luteoviolacea]AOT17884.1 hypothetical protein S4054_09435 [Pseudoalteromonas luteoviolacea]KKE84393.1 hypothetical protein N479_09125 [Pseudoalteromonas luteoviolacea S4054]KZN71768.1 hypothetical protein N481_17665 [Pseudoalteromonas luteoviolacea S4047-1]